ncbi:MAG: chorismate-binding protein [Bacteroidota bacterium]
MSDNQHETSLAIQAEVQLHNLLAFASQSGLAFACWRLPNNSTTHAIIDTGGQLHKGKQSLESSAPGFLVSPFVNNERSEEVFLHADIHIITQGKDSSINITLDPNRSVKANEFLNDVSINNDRQQFKLDTSPKDVSPSDGHNSFLNFVAECVDAIHQGRFKKVVPSRFKDLKLDDSINPLVQFTKICDHYPASFASFISLPESGTWLGASPEVLVKMTGDIFSTMALAGTQRITPDQDLRDVAWTQKEIEEQAMVSRYIINCFKKIRLREFEENGPRTIKAANLIHLLTEYEVDMAAVNFPQLGSVMVELLHPTSAVCGMPLEPAMEFLLSHEKHDRELYSGYLGPVNIENSTQLFVNLRCMRVYDHLVRAFVGAGVTEGSLPEKEWLETEYKSQTMLDLVRVNP